MSSMYPAGDPRAALTSAQAVPAAPRSRARAATVLDLVAEKPDAELPLGGRTWVVRGQNFVVALTDVRAGERLAVEGGDDEHIVVVCAGTVSVSHAGHDTDDETVHAAASTVVIVPPGDSTLTAHTDGRVVRIFAAGRAGLAAAARNADDYRAANPLVALPGTPGRPLSERMRVHRLDDVEPEPGRLGRILRSSSLMINWFPDEHQPRDPDRLSPHWHDDFEQCSVTLAGTYVHHLRTTWTSRLADWRPDEHIQVESPSITVIPPPLIHTTQAVGDGLHQLLDIFAPPRRDFLDQGWVLNAADYAAADDVPADDTQKRPPA
ncbi:hypothetical protein ACFZDK_48615 [Streptomyces sp. NPDC007901]|uniref:hypothetical protein n=1 Tax=Streptomyces sp. NPDC007901 TaxID=3364785 RepID=UPI0036F097AF